jgi:single-stranded DNA-binding protein
MYMQSNPKKGDAGKNGRHNFINLTLQAGKDGEGKYGGSGVPFATCRAFYSQGKDKSTDEYLPSLWVTVKAFGEKGKDIDDVPTVLALANITKGSKFDVKGRLGLEEWTNGNGEKQSTLVIFATEVKAAAGNGAATDDEPQP